MNTVHLAWMLGRPSSTRGTSQILTVSAYAMVGAMLLVVLGGAYSFTSFEREAQAAYLPLAGFAVVLLAVPLMVLGRCACWARPAARSAVSRCCRLPAPPWPGPLPEWCCTWPARRWWR